MKKMSRASVEQRKVKNFDFNEFVKNPLAFFAFENHEHFNFVNNALNDNFLLAASEMRECACGFFDRLSNNRRKEIETNIVSYVTQQHAEKENFSLRLLSFGAGYFLQDFILLCKLIKSGYKFFSLTCVDTLYKEDFTELHIKIDSLGNKFFNNPSFDDLIAHPLSFFQAILNPFTEIKKFPAISQFIELLQAIAAEFNVTIKLHFYSNLDQINKSNNNSFHVITTIDNEKLEEINELATLHKLLSPNGRFFLSVNSYDFIFNKESCLVKTNCFKDADFLTPLEDIRRDMIDNQVKQAGETIRYIQLSSSYPAKIIEWFYILPALSKHHDCSQIHLNYVVDDNNNKICAENLAYFLQLFLPEGKIVSVKITPGLQKFISQRKQIDADIISLLYWHMQDPEKEAEQYEHFTAYLDSNYGPHKKLLLDSSMRHADQENRQQLLVMLREISQARVYCDVSIGEFKGTWKWHNGEMTQFSIPGTIKTSISNLIFGSRYSPLELLMSSLSVSDSDLLCNLLSAMNFLPQAPTSSEDSITQQPHAANPHTVFQHKKLDGKNKKPELSDLASIIKHSSRAFR